MSDNGKVILTYNYLIFKIMNKVYLLTYWSENDKKGYIAGAFHSRQRCKEMVESLNKEWEGLGRIYHIETLTFFDE